MKIIFFLIFVTLTNLSMADEGQAHSKKRHQCRHGGEGLLHRKAPRKFVKLPSLHLHQAFDSLDRTLTPLPNFKVDFKILILSATNDGASEPSFLEAQKALQSLGMPFDIKVLTTNGVRNSTTPLNLINTDGSGKYYGIVTTTGELAFQTSGNAWDSALTTAQWDELKAYEAQYSVRRVSLYTFPTDLIGVSAIPGKENGNPNNLVFTSLTTPFISGIPSNAKPPLIGTWMYPASIVNTTMAKAFMLFKDSTIASVISTFSDGRQQMHYFFDQSIFTSGSMIIAPIWVKWLTHGAFIGKRRMYLNPQVDDLFLETDLWDPRTQTTPEDGSRIYRVSTNDITTFLNFQNTTIRTLTGNPTYRTEIAFNGAGVGDYGGYTSDPLFLKMKSVATNFNFLNHTWDHEDLTNMSYDLTTLEITQNYDTAQKLLVWQTPNYSQNSMVTPGISGLFNSEALRAIHDQNILNVTGDNSRPELVNSTNPYLGLYTTLATNNYAGIFILPRHATEIYYNASTKTELVSEYNFLYRNYFGKDSTFAEILAREEELAVGHLLGFEPAPFMFHQANLRRFLQGLTYESVLSLWIKQVVGGIRKYSTLPILNARMNDIKEVYLNRQKFENCLFKGQLEVTNFKIVKINATSKGTCQVAISGVNGGGTGVSTETYGPDTNLLFTMDGVTPKTITVNTPIAVNL